MTTTLTTTSSSQLEASSAPALAAAIDLWALSTTRDGDRLEDLLRDKKRIVRHFFAFVARRPQDVQPGDVRRWLDELRAHGIPTVKPDGAVEAGEGFSAAGVYAAASRVSSFYRWLLKDEALRGVILHGQWPDLGATAGYSVAALVVLALGAALFKALRPGFADVL